MKRLASWLLLALLAGGCGGDREYPVGVEQTLRGGLRFTVLEAGAGPAARRDQPLVVHYTGWVEGEAEPFESSRDTGAPVLVVAGQPPPFPGWEPGLTGVRLGEKRRLSVPPGLAYGAEGRPDRGIPPNATLVYEVELVEMGATD